MEKQFVQERDTYIFSLEQLRSGEGKLRLRVAPTVQDSIEVKAHVDGLEEACLYPSGVSCTVCGLLFSREKFVEHAHAADGTVEIRAPVELKEDPAKKTVLNVLKKAKPEGHGDPNLVSEFLLHIRGGPANPPRLHRSNVSDGLYGLGMEP